MRTRTIVWAGAGLIAALVAAMVTAPANAETQANLMRNPSFNDNALPYGLWRDVNPVTSYLIRPWRVTQHYGQLVSTSNAQNNGNSAFHMGSWRHPAQGGNMPGAVAQTLTTQPGEEVTVKFGYAPLPHPSCQNPALAGLGKIKASARRGADDGDILGQVTVSADTKTITWRQAEFTFTPPSDTTVVYFESLPSNSFCSLMFSNLSATAKPTPPQQADGPGPFPKGVFLVRNGTGRCLGAFDKPQIAQSDCDSTFDKHQWTTRGDGKTPDILMSVNRKNKGWPACLVVTGMNYGAKFVDCDSAEASQWGWDANTKTIRSLTGNAEGAYLVRGGNGWLVKGAPPEDISSGMYIQTKTWELVPVRG